MKCFLILLLFINPTILYTQSLSLEKIQKMAQKVTSQSIKNVDVNGITFRNCFAVGRTLVYEYEVPPNWYPTINMKDQLIENLKKNGSTNIYLKNAISLDFNYYKGKSLVKKISIKDVDFSTFNFQLGEYISIKDHPKAKGVNLQIKMPIGWEVEEGVLPNTVKKFLNKGNTYSILIKDNVTFFSRKQIREMLQNENFVKEFVENECAFFNTPIVLEQSVVSINNYPAIRFLVKGKMEQQGLTVTIIMKNWVVFYEDKKIYLAGGGIDNPEFGALEQVYSMITNSVIFPDQYN